MSENIREELLARRRELNELERRSKNEHNHKDNHGPCLTPVSDYDGFIRDRHKYDEFDMICEVCGEIFSLKSVTRDEAVQAIKTIRSIVNQLKVLTNPNDNEYRQLVDILDILDGFEKALLPYYEHNITKLLGNKGKNRNNNNGPQKGKMSKAVTSQSFNRR